MATMTVSLPDAAIEWIEEKVRRGLYQSTDDYLRSLISHEQAKEDEGPGILDFPPPDDRQFTLEELRLHIERSRASGIGSRTIAEVIAEGDRRIADTRTVRG